MVESKGKEIVFADVATSAEPWRHLVHIKYEGMGVNVKQASRLYLL